MSGFPDSPVAWIAKLRPEAFEDAPLYAAIQRFYSPGALIQTRLVELSELLAHKELRVASAQGKPLNEAALLLLDACPEIMDAKGCLRFYECPAPVDWTACEQAEIALGEAFSSGTYGFSPDFFTVLEGKNYSITAIVAI
jgi:hypothetical protein